MKLEVRGNADSLRTLQRALKEKFTAVEFDTHWHEVLIVKAYAASDQCQKIRDFVEAFCVGAGTTWNAQSF